MIRRSISCMLAGLLTAVPGAILPQALAVDASSGRWTIGHTGLLFSAAMGALWLLEDIADMASR